MNSCGGKLNPNAAASEAPQGALRSAACLEFCLLALESGPMRLDQALAQSLPEFSRAQLSLWIREGRVHLDGAATRPKDKVAGRECVLIEVPAVETSNWQAEAIDLDIVYEDAHILVINKAAGLVVHPGAGNPAGTLLNALLHHCPALGVLARAGIVHRLDKETSGLMVIAKTEVARLDLIEQLAARTVKREYLALVCGQMIAGGTVDAPIGRSSRDRTRMAVTSAGKDAVTHYRVEQRFRAHTLVRATLESGRTHQIRVHMAHIHFPLFGDPVYGPRLRLPAAATPTLVEVLRNFRRQALHATRLALIHPGHGELMEWERSVPEDMQLLLAALDDDRVLHS